MKIDRAVCADVGRKHTSSVHEASSLPATPFIPRGSPCMRIHKSPAETTSAKYLTRDRTAAPLMSLACDSLLVCEEHKKKLKKGKEERTRTERKIGNWGKSRLKLQYTAKTHSDWVTLSSMSGGILSRQANSQ